MKLKDTGTQKELLSHYFLSPAALIIRRQNWGTHKQPVGAAIPFPPHTHFSWYHFPFPPSHPLFLSVPFSLHVYCFSFLSASPTTSLSLSSLAAVAHLASSLQQRWQLLSHRFAALGAWHLTQPPSSLSSSFGLLAALGAHLVSSLLAACCPPSSFATSLVVVVHGPWPFYSLGGGSSAFSPPASSPPQPAAHLVCSLPQQQQQLLPLLPTVSLA